jgi:hypothetical protein
MWHAKMIEMAQSGFWRRCVLMASVSLLAGCAATLSTRVTSYQQWPAGVQGQTYEFVPSTARANNLEYDSFADMLRAAIGPTGLVEAASGKRARFDVSFTYENPLVQSWTQQYVDPPFYNGFGPYNRGWAGGMYFGPSVVYVPVQYYKNTLSVSIKDRDRHGAEVYRSSAVNMSGSDNLPAIMPYLARAVFEGFPGNNGQVRVIRYEINPR